MSEDCLSPIELEDIRIGEEERKKGLTKRFTNTEDLFKWLDSD